MEHSAPIGERIAYWRKRHEKTQAELAGLVGRSVPWLSAVERGKHPMDSISVLLRLANVLKVGIWELQPKLGLPPNGGDPHDPPNGLLAISQAVMTTQAPDREAPSAADLRAQVERAKQLRQAGQHLPLKIVLPELLIAGRAAVAQQAPDAWWCLGGAYQVASSFARAFGDTELAWISADRAVTAARESGDELLVAVSRRLLGCAFMRRGKAWLGEAGAVCSDAADAIAPTDRTPPEGWVVWGSVHLSEGVAAARAGDRAGAGAAMRDARAAAERVGSDRNDYWEAFGPANVGAIEVAIALESEDAFEALRIADRVEVEELPSAERRARFCIDVARAYSLQSNDQAMVLMVKEATRHAPQVVRYSAGVRELVLVGVNREKKRSRTPGLRKLAEQLNVAD
ncbi:MAG: helix-turn-helix domain-containing protein [Egibacteraceae bacterium]